jgi:glycosyltransferase involved in cell wall biosynthesis
MSRAPPVCARRGQAAQVEIRTGCKNVLPISVIIPIYNHEQYIRHCLGSLSLGTPPEEIILVDNASTDGSVAAAEDLGLPNLRVVRNERNLGATQARHIAMQEARCEHFCFLDSDDWLGPQALDLAFGKLIEDALDVSLFTMLRISNDEKTILFSLDPPRGVASGQDAFELTLGEWRINASGVYKRALYDPAFEQLDCTGHSDDEILTRLMFLQAGRIGGTSGVYNYRWVEKPPTVERVVGQTRTNLRVLELAAARSAQLKDRSVLRSMRNVVVRNLLGLTVRALRGQCDVEAVRELYSTYARVPVDWTRADARFRLFDRLVAAGVAAVGRIRRSKAG